MTIPPGPPPPEGPPSGGEAPRSYSAEPYPVAVPVYTGYYGQPDHRPPASKAMAGWALALSIMSCAGIGSLVAIGLSIAVLVKGQRDGRNHGKGMAIAALILSGLTIVGGVIVVVLMVTGKIEYDDSDRDRSGEITEEQVISLTSLRVGDCLGIGELDEMRREGQYEVTAVPCSQPHSGELYHLFDLPDGDFPGDAEAARLGEAGCWDAFRDYVGVRPQRSTLGLTYLSPESVSWRIADDRAVYCFLSEPDESTIGSLEGSKR